MQNIKIIYLYLIVSSATVICFEILSTRICSVIFVNNYAFIILSLAILGLASGGIYSFYKIKTNPEKNLALIFRLLMLSGASLLLFIVCVTELKVTSPVLFFILLFLPLFFFGIIYAQVFKNYAEYSFTLYASDLAGAALGAVAPILLINLFGAPNNILLLSIVIFGVAGIYLIYNSSRKNIAIFYSVVTAALLFIIINGSNDVLAKVPIGKFDEKDFYYVYPNAEELSEIVESRWSIYGRTDLVQYRHQNLVKQLFVDGAAGSQMYHFNGNINGGDKRLYDLLIRHSNAVPYFFLNKQEKNSMLVIGPGGGKEILTGLLAGVDQITGVEINPDFVNIVKDHKDFNGGIYTNFPNVNIEIAEGRHYIKKTKNKYDLIVMALPSTEQVQNIDGLAENENYLLTIEALTDYLNSLTNEGYLIFTVHNQWELLRLTVTAIEALRERNNNNNGNELEHLAIIETEYAPTIIIKKNAFTTKEITNWRNINRTIPGDIPSVTYMPSYFSKNSVVNNFIEGLHENKYSLDEYVKNHKYDISPCSDDSPYFYKINKQVPGEFAYLNMGIFVLYISSIGAPYLRIKNKFIKDRLKDNKNRNIFLLIAVFTFLGSGFMILELSLFQKLILYLGTPTISLSILLSSLLIGMGCGSYFSRKLKKDITLNRLIVTCILVILAGIVFFLIYPLILGVLLKYSLFFRAIVSFIIIFPLGFLLGIPFPTAIQLLKKYVGEEFIPWMYGINGLMSVFGSILAVILSMLYGFTITFFAGLFFYMMIFLFVKSFSRDIK